jgi:hypothetical protein
MRKKSHVTVQKWVDSISLAAHEEDNNVLGAESEKQIKRDCDNSELNAEQPSTSSVVSEESTGAGVKGKLTEICNKLNVNEKLKSKKVQEFKNLLAKTTQKIKDKNNKAEVNMEQHEKEEEIKDEVQKEEEVEIVEDINEKNTEIDRTKRCHLSTLGRSVSESPRPPPRTRRLTDIGRSFSVAQDNELPNDSSDNLIYDDPDDDTSLAIPSPNTSPSNSQLNRNLSGLRPPERPLRMHTVSEGHYSPHVLPKNQLLRDCSFQVRRKFLIYFSRQRNNYFSIYLFSLMKVTARVLKVCWSNANQMLKQF